MRINAKVTPAAFGILLTLMGMSWTVGSYPSYYKTLRLGIGVEL